MCEFSVGTSYYLVNKLFLKVIFPLERAHVHKVLSVHTVRCYILHLMILNLANFFLISFCNSLVKKDSWLSNLSSLPRIYIFNIDREISFIIICLFFVAIELLRRVLTSVPDVIWHTTCSLNHISFHFVFTKYPYDARSVDSTYPVYSWRNMTMFT